MRKYYYPLTDKTDFQARCVRRDRKQVRSGTFCPLAYLLQYHIRGVKKGVLKHMIQHFQLLLSANEMHIRTLNNLAVNYFELGLQDLSYHIWDELFHEIQRDSNYDHRLIPIISCNMGNVLRKTGYYEESYRVLLQGLDGCFGTGAMYAMPELILQLSFLRMKFGHMKEARSLYKYGTHLLLWTKQSNMSYPMEEGMKQDFLLYCKEDK